MKIGIPKEIKNHEYRVGLIPDSVKELTNLGHQVIVETNAGMGIGSEDKDYINAGATIVDTAQEVFEQATLIVKVKEPQPVECKMLRPHHTLFTFLHLAIDPVQAELLMASGANAIAYETVVDINNRLPLLTPMSEVAGRVSVQLGAHCLEKAQGGKGILLSGVPGVSSAEIVILGGGVVGTSALKLALGMGANVTVFDKSLDRLRTLEDLFGSRLKTHYATQTAIDEHVKKADLVIGAVLIPGAQAPKLVSKETVFQMQPGSVMVDVAIDQGGCFETSRATTFDEPTYLENGVVHSCVTNLPGSVAKTSSLALNHATLPFVIELAEKGCEVACKQNHSLMEGLNVAKGKITHAAVAEALNLPYHVAKEVL